ncbi:type II pantothenate kinase [Paenibacillus sp. LMG 31456]|uniref:Type II pantothenate kinase n=1 Tax=Paenibacillus foliorum TaxID=2654974 RepID=A0A972GV01_9BACL|nr:type II pantothenate kinase [Paenibacillus foliorum]NOU93315.1 type II pantothenate kinase [Paenibacillus foliorum]
MKQILKMGIDAGGTLIKIAYKEEASASLEFINFPSARMQEAVSWIMQHAPKAKVSITGGKAALLQSYLSQNEISTIVEFDATCSGVQYLLRDIKTAPEAFVLTNCGTGTSIHYTDPNKHYRLGGSGVGGGTLIGLSYLLTGIGDFNEIIHTAKNGNRERVDLKVSHIYEGAVPPIPGDLTASNFGNVRLDGSNTREVADLLASVMGLVGETVTTASVLAAGQCGVSSIVYIGSSFVGNGLLQDIVTGYTKLRGAEAVFLDHGPFSGAIGAWLSL